LTQRRSSLAATGLASKDGFAQLGWDRTLGVLASTMFCSANHWKIGTPSGLQTRWRAEHTLAFLRSKEMFPRRRYRGLIGKSPTAGVVVEVVEFLRLYPS
jgi:hypothetical protein